MSNPWQPCSDTIWCSTGLLGWPDLHGLTNEWTNSHKNAKNTRKNAAEYSNTNKIQEPFPLPVGPTGPIESTRRWEIGK